MPGVYPDYTANTQDTARDLPGRTDIANAADYNSHDVEIITHQNILKSIVGTGTTVFRAVSSLPASASNGEAVFLTTDKHPYVYQA